MSNVFCTHYLEVMLHYHTVNTVIFHYWTAIIHGPGNCSVWKNAMKSEESVKENDRAVKSLSVYLFVGCQSQVQ